MPTECGADLFWWKCVLAKQEEARVTHIHHARSARSQPESRIHKSSKVSLLSNQISAIQEDA